MAPIVTTFTAQEKARLTQLGATPAGIANYQNDLKYSHLTRAEVDHSLDVMAKEVETNKLTRAQLNQILLAPSAASLSSGPSIGLGFDLASAGVIGTALVGGMAAVGAKRPNEIDNVMTKSYWTVQKPGTSAGGAASIVAGSTPSVEKATTTAAHDVPQAAEDVAQFTGHDRLVGAAKGARTGLWLGLGTAAGILSMDAGEAVASQLGYKSDSGQMLGSLAGVGVAGAAGAGLLAATRGAKPGTATTAMRGIGAGTAMSTGMFLGLAGTMAAGFGVQQLLQHTNANKFTSSGVAAAGAATAITAMALGMKKKLKGPVGTVAVLGGLAVGLGGFFAAVAPKQGHLQPPTPPANPRPADTKPTDTKPGDHTPADDNTSGGIPRIGALPL
jgi:hypothetical protein